MAGFDEFAKRVPGGVQTKVFVGVSAILLFTGYPIFFGTAKHEKGGHYFSQEKPEAIHKHTEKLQKEFRERKKQES